MSSLKDRSDVDGWTGHWRGSKWIYVFWQGLKMALDLITKIESETNGTPESWNFFKLNHCDSCHFVTLFSESSLFELNSLAARQDLLTLAAQQLNVQFNGNSQRNRQRPPRIEGEL